MEKIFISYSRQDKETVYPFVAEIEKRIGQKCWIDLNGIESSDEFIDKIIHAINKSEIVIFMHSELSAKAPYVRKEIQFAFNKGKRVVLVLIDNTPIDDYFQFQFGTLNYINYAKTEEKERLFKDLCFWLGTPMVHTPTQPIHSTPLNDNSIIQPPKETSSSIKEERLFNILQSWLWLPIIQIYKRTFHSISLTKKSNIQYRKENVSSTKKYKIGDKIVINDKIGTVFFITDGGKHGKAVSCEETIASWCVKNDLDVDTGALSFSNGSENTRKIQKMPLWKKRFPAFSWCKNFGKDWYLPAIEEVEQFTQRHLHNKSYNIERYWSSTEKDKQTAFYKFITGGYPYPGSKARNRYVRAVAAF